MSKSVTLHMKKKMFTTAMKQTVSCTGTGTDQNFITGCRCFFKNRRLYQTMSTNQKFFIRYRYFSWLYLFVTLGHFSQPMSLTYLSGDGLIFFCFFVVCGALGLSLWLKSKNCKGVSHFLVCWGVTTSNTNISLPQCLCEWLQDWTRGLIGDGIINRNQSITGGNTL